MIQNFEKNVYLMIQIYHSFSEEYKFQSDGSYRESILIESTISSENKVLAVIMYLNLLIEETVKVIN